MEDNNKKVSEISLQNASSSFDAGIIEWECPKCTLLNNQNLDKCNVCGDYIERATLVEEMRKKFNYQIMITNQKLKMNEITIQKLEMNEIKNIDNIQNNENPDLIKHQSSLSKYEEKPVKRLFCDNDFFNENECLDIASISQPSHKWQIKKIPFINHLQKEKILANKQFNCVYPFLSKEQQQKLQQEGKQNNTLFKQNIPTNAVKFGLIPVNNGKHGLLWERQIYPNVEIAQFGNISRINNKKIAIEGLTEGKVRTEHEDAYGVQCTPSFTIASRVQGTPIRYKNNIQKILFQCRVRNIIKKIKNIDFIGSKTQHEDWLVDPNDIQIYGLLIKKFDSLDEYSTLGPKKDSQNLNWYKYKDNKWINRKKDHDFDFDVDSSGKRIDLGLPLTEHFLNFNDVQKEDDQSESLDAFEFYNAMKQK